MAQRLNVSRVVSLILNSAQLGLMLVMSMLTIVSGFFIWDDDGWMLVLAGLFIFIFAYFQYYIAVGTLWRYRFVEKEN